MEAFFGGMGGSGDKAQWHCIAEIAKSFVAIDADEQVLVEELEKLPGGREALAALNSGQGGRDKSDKEKLAKLKANIEAAKNAALQQAEAAKQQAEEARKQADFADDVAAGIVPGGPDSYNEYCSMPAAGSNGSTAVPSGPSREAQDAKQLVDEADLEARRFAELAGNANRDLQKAQAEWARAVELANQKAAYANNLMQQLEEGKRAAQAAGFGAPGSKARDGGPYVDPNKALRDKEADAEKRRRDAAKAAADAARAREKARRAKEQLAKLKEANRPDGPAKQLEQVNNQVDDANKAKLAAAAAQKRLEGLQYLMSLLDKELDAAKKLAADKAREADEAEDKARDALAKAKPFQDAVGHGVDPAAMQAAIDAANKALADAEAAARAADEQAAGLQNDAADADRDAQAAAQQVQQYNIPDFKQLEDQIAKSRAEAEEARCIADGLGAAARAAANYARSLQERAQKALADLNKLKQRLAEIEDADKKRAKSGGDGGRPAGPPGGKRSMIPGGKTPGQAAMDADRDRAKAAAAEAAAAKALADALKAEADAKRVAELLKMLERVRKERASLAGSMGKVHKEAAGSVQESAGMMARDGYA